MTSERIASKPHLILLDALRGVAALIVIWYHCYEGFATSVVTQSCNHGYLAVDFFFILSGFVIGFAYEKRLACRSVTTGDFFKRRLIRLHPMVVFGVVFGVVTFIAGGRTNWAGETSPFGWIMLAMLLNMFMIPLYPGCSADIRGNGEMFPLNGPHWSLFFEYIGNILYVLLLRKLKTRTLAAVTAVSGAILCAITVSNGYLGVGWTLPDFWSGLIRMLFPYSAGLLLSRFYSETSSKGRFLMPAFIRRHALLICSIVLLVLLPMPFVGTESSLWVNGIYVSLIVVAVFPALIWIAAEGSCSVTEEGRQGRICTVLGDLSYPLYAVHYPIMYLFYQHIGFPEVNTTMAAEWPVALGAAAASVAVAALALKFYDKPVRRYLTQKYLR